MTSGFGTMKDADCNQISYFHDSSDCLKGEEHDWSAIHSMMTAEDAKLFARCECGAGIYVDKTFTCQRCRDCQYVTEMLMSVHDHIDGRLEEILEMYAEDHRRYHTREHLDDMFRTAEENDIELSDEQVVAIWFHDCVYRVPRDVSQSNEEASAKVATEFLRDAGVGDRFIWTVERIIRDTEDKLPRLRASHAVIDLDLWQLSNDDFWKNEKPIREEFGLFTDEEWRRGREAFFEKMLARETIFVSEHATPEMEEGAQRNFRTALEQLKKEDG